MVPKLSQLLQRRWWLNIKEVRDTEESIRGENVRKKKFVPKVRGASEDTRETNHTTEDDESNGANF